jgi:hypothetical protein
MPDEITSAEAYSWARDTFSDLLYGQPREVTIRPGTITKFSPDGLPVVSTPRAPRRRLGSLPLEPHVAVVVRQDELQDASPGSPRMNITEAICRTGQQRRGSDEPFIAPDTLVRVQADYKIGSIPGETGETAEVGIRFLASRASSQVLGRFQASPYVVGSPGGNDTITKGVQGVEAYVASTGHRNVLHDTRHTDYLGAVLLLDHCVQQVGAWDRVIR